MWPSVWRIFLHKPDKGTWPFSEIKNKRRSHNKRFCMPTASFVPKVDSVLFEPEVVSAMIDPFTNAIAIIGTAAEGIPSVALYLPKDITAGTYDLGTPGFADYGAQYNIDDMTFLGAENGQVTVTKHDKGVKIIEGAFFFEGTELTGNAKASLTEGSFMVSY